LAIHILMSHVFPKFFYEIGLADWIVVLLASSAGISTQIFFLLSGFVLMYNYRNNDASWWRNLFYKMRKIWPTFAIPTTLACVYFLIVNPNNYSQDLIVFQWGEWFKSLLLLEPWFNDKPVYNIAAWASSVFALGYLTISIFGEKLLSFGTKVWIPLCLCFVASFSLTICFVIFFQDDLSGPYAPFKQYSPAESAFRHFPAYRFLEILIGIFAAILYRNNPQRWEQKNSNITLLLTISIPCVVVLMCMWNATSAFLFTHGAMLPLLVIWLLLFASDSNWFDRLGKSKIMEKGSEYSLAIFFIHWPLHRILMDILSNQDQQNIATTWTYFFIYLVTLCALIIPLKKIVDGLAEKIELKLCMEPATS
jgi:peptidoglycan/LPS O-acetylase OafA/YrhL